MNFILSLFIFFNVFCCYVLSQSTNLKFTAEIVVQDPYIAGLQVGDMKFNGPENKIKVDYSLSTGGTVPLSEVSNYNSKSVDPNGGQTRVKVCPNSCQGFGQTQGIPMYTEQSSDTNVAVPDEFKTNGVPDIPSRGGKFPVCNSCKKKANPDNSGGVTMVCFQSNGDLCGAKESGGKVIWFKSYQSGVSFPNNEFDVDTNCFSNCDAPLEIGLILDQSGSINNQEWSDLLDFVKQLVNRFEIGPGRVRFTTAIYSCPEGSSGSGYSYLLHGYLDSKQAILNKINNINKRGGCTCIACGQEVMYKEMAQNSRALVPKVVITLTDGVANQPCPSRNPLRSDGKTYSRCDCPGNPCRNEQYDFLLAAEQQIEGLPFLAEQISIAVGDNTADNELTLLAGDNPDNKVKVDSFAELPSIIDRLLEISCPVPSSNDCGSDCKGVCLCGGVCECPDVCDDGDTCTNDVCRTGTALSGCVYTKRNPLNDGSQNCNKGDKCKVYSCDSITGCGQVDKVCNADPNQPCKDPTCDSSVGCLLKDTNRCDSSDWCKLGSCDAMTGQCVTTDRPIDDGNACTIDACDSDKKIITHTPIRCPNLNPCFTETCNTMTGQCEQTAVNCGACEISPGVGKNCTLADIGSTNLCEIPGCDTQTGDCIKMDEISCVDPSNACNLGACNTATGECEFTPKDCPDQPCKTVECNPMSGECEYTDVDCSVGVTSACIADAQCDTSTNECVFTPVNCTTPDLCIDWTCDSVEGCVAADHDCGPEVEDNDECTIPRCNNATGCYVENVTCPVDACSETVCDPATGICVEGRIFCLPEDSCTISTCEPPVDDPTAPPVCLPDGGGKRDDLKCDPATIGAVAGGLAGGIIAAIVIAAIVVAVLASVGAAVGYNKMFQTGLDANNATNSPIYKGGSNYESPLA